MAYRPPLIAYPDQAKGGESDYLTSQTINVPNRFPMFFTMQDFAEETPNFYGANGTCWNVWTKYGVTQAAPHLPDCRSAGILQRLRGRPTRHKPGFSQSSDLCNPARNRSCFVELRRHHGVKLYVCRGNERVRNDDQCLGSLAGYNLWEFQFA